MEQLTREVRQLNQQLHDLRDAIERNYAPRSETLRQRRRLGGAVLAVMLLLAVGGYLTQRVTLTREHQLVATCFLQPASRPPPAACSREFPGYAQMRRQQQAALRTFVDLQGRVANLEAQQHK